MKLMHISDLHLGKRVNEFPMLEDQKYILQRIIAIADEEAVDGVLLAGDVYDKSVPSAEAVQLLDDFVWELSKGRPLFVISGNHDSAERMAWGSRILSAKGVHIARPYAGAEKPLYLEDESGRVAIHLLPFVKPAHVRAAYPDEEIGSYTDAIACAVEHMQIDSSERNVLVTHQFVTGASRSESEEISVGGTDNVDADVLEVFDYVALGHIHGPQNIGSERIRYCGTPLKYSFSEKDHQKSVTIVELGAKRGATERCEIAVRAVALAPLHDMREIRGSYEELTCRDNYEGTTTDDYLRVVLTDEVEIMEAMNRLRSIYPNIMRLEYDNTRTRSRGAVEVRDDAELKSEVELFAMLYEMQNGQAPDEEQMAYLEALVEEIKEA